MASAEGERCKGHLFDVGPEFEQQKRKGVRIILTEEERSLALRLAKAYGSVKRPGQSDKSRLSSASQFEVDLASALGRVAIIEHFLGLKSDHRARIAGDTGKHVMLPSGQSLDVKTTRSRSGPLALGGPKPGMQLRTDVIALAEVIELNGEVKLCGWTTAARFKRLYRMRDLGHGMREVVGQSSLLHIDGLRHLSRGERPAHQEGLFVV